MRFYPKIRCIRCIACLLLVFLSTVSFASASSDYIEVNIGKINNESFGTIIKKISSNSGVAISCDDSLLNILITGVFCSISFEEFLRRVLKDKNYSVLTSRYGGNIVIQSVGNKQKITASEGYVEIKRTENFSALPPVSSRKILEKQDRILKDKLREQYVVDSLVDVDVAAIQQIHLRQDAVLQNRKFDFRENESVEKDNFVSVKKYHKKQELSLQDKDIALQRAILEQTGIEVVTENLHRQSQCLRENLANVNYVDPVIGITLSMLNRIHKQQELALKRN